MATLAALRDILPQWYMTTDVVHHPTTQKLVEIQQKAKRYRDKHMTRFNKQIPKTEIRGARLQRIVIVKTLLKYMSMTEIQTFVPN